MLLGMIIEKVTKAVLRNFSPGLPREGRILHLHPYPNTLNPLFLLVSQRHYRIDFRGATRGDVAR